MILNKTVLANENILNVQMPDLSDRLTWTCCVCRGSKQEVEAELPMMQVVQVAYDDLHSLPIVLWLLYHFTCRFQ